MNNNSTDMDMRIIEATRKEIAEKGYRYLNALSLFSLGLFGLLFILSIILTPERLMLSRVIEIIMLVTKALILSNFIMTIFVIKGHGLFLWKLSDEQVKASNHYNRKVKNES